MTFFRIKSAGHVRSNFCLTSCSQAEQAPETILISCTWLGIESALVTVPAYADRKLARTTLLQSRDIKTPEHARDILVVYFHKKKKTQA